MRNFIRKLIFLTILTLATQVIRLPGVGLSIFQLLVIATVAVGLPYVLSKTVKEGSYFFTSLLWGLSTLIAWVVSINAEWGKSCLLLGLMTSLLLFIIPNCLKRSDIPQLIKIMIWSQYIVIPFSVFCLYIYYTVGGSPDVIPLPFGMSITPSEDALDRGTAAGEIRLYLPYATPPILSIVMSMCITLLLFCKGLFKTYQKWILISVFTLILIMTGSRSGIVGILFVVVFLFFNGELKYVFKRGKFKIVLSLIVVIAVFAMVSQTEYVQKMVFGRMENIQNTTLMQDRHFLVPLDGLLIWIDSFKNFVVGIGFGSGYYMKGAHTFLPPYFMNSFVTLLAERGIMGLTLVIFLIRLTFKLVRLRKFLNDNERALVYSLFVGLFCGFFYENFNSYFVIFTIVLSFLLESSLPKRLPQKLIKR